VSHDLEDPIEVGVFVDVQTVSTGPKISSTIDFVERILTWTTVGSMK
jgi:hypothetical protein